jgi:hypothetical protein
VSVTKTFGDTLRASNFIPLAALTDTSAKAKPDTFKVVTGSQGIQQVQEFTPDYSQGKLIGFTDDDKTIAKPTTITDTREAASSQVSTTAVKDSAAKVDSITKKTIGFGLPSWVFWVLGIVALGAIIYFVKPFLKFI